MPTDEAGQYVVDARGRRTGVIPPIKRYRKLMEDLHDPAVVAGRRGEGPISRDELKRRLGPDAPLWSGSVYQGVL